MTSKPVTTEDMYKPNSNLSFMIDFGEFHPAFKDHIGTVINENNEQHMD